MGKVVERVAFKVDGEWFTNFIRDLYYGEDLSYEECKDRLIKSLCLGELSEGEKEDLADKILYGKKKLVGINELDLVDDIDFDVYKHSRFQRPIFEGSGMGIRGILTRDGVFVQCEHGQHSSTIERIGFNKCQGSLVFWLTEFGEDGGITKDSFNERLTIRQKEWCKQHRDFLTEDQINSLNILITIENFKSANK